MVRSNFIALSFGFLLLLFFGNTKLFGIDKPVSIYRICLDDTDSTAHLFWNSNFDTCGSFLTYQIYGRDEKLSLFELMDTINDKSRSEAIIKLKNTKTWEFFIVSKFACNGIDTLISDTVEVDLKQPEEWELDSVSVDLQTQRTIIGWKNHPEPDAQAFFLYYVGNSNSLLADTNGLFYMDLIYGNPSQKSEKYSLATYDSCGNTSPISNGLNTIFLTGDLDTCGRKINLQWSEYQGVDIEKYKIKLSSDSFNNFEIVASVSDDFIYSYEDVKSESRYCFVVQMESENGVTSSSNRICFETPKVTGAENNIHKVTVNEDKSIGIYLMSQLGEGTITLNKSENGKDFYKFKVINPNNFSGDTMFIDRDVEVDSNIYYYQIIHEDGCGYNIIDDSSAISNTVLLNVEEGEIEAEITWNYYNTFAEGVGQYHIFKESGLEIRPRSTWNLNDVLGPSQNESFDMFLHNEASYKLCYVLSAIEESENIYGRQDTSYSNSVCFIRDLAIFFPTAFAPEGINTHFSPVGIGIIEKDSSSKMEIYNRWGEKIYETYQVTQGWDGKDYQGNFCPAGTYVYYARIKGEQGEAVEFKGTFYLMK